MGLTFRTKLLTSYVALVVAVVALGSFELNRSLGQDLVQQLDERLEKQAEGAAQWVGSGRHPNRLAGRLAAVVGAEIALIDGSGAVLGFADPRAAAPRGSAGSETPDTPVIEMPGQNAYPEVRAAHAGEPGHVTRADRTGEPMRYVAVPAGSGLVLRLGVPLAGIDATLRAMRHRLLFAAVLAVAAAVVLGLVAASVVARPLRAMAASARKIADGDYEVRPAAKSPDEFGALAAALTSLAAQLEARIGDLTAERDRLSTLLAQVRRLEVVRRDFVANVSHELRTPVTAIQGYAETLLSTTPDEATRTRFLETIHRHAQRLGRLLEDLLKLSAIEAQNPEQVAREAVPVRALCNAVAQTMEERRKAAGASLTIDAAEDLFALGDPAGMEQVIENLVDNALKYGPAGGGVRLVASRADGNVRIAVENDGPGIAAEHLPRLFERFYRVDPARSRERGGAGLGLAIVKHLVEAMEGKVEATSEPEKGSRFTVTLPEAAAPGEGGAAGH